MTLPRRHHRYTYADYVALETISSEKHEFLDVEIFALAGGSEERDRAEAHGDGGLRRGAALPPGALL